MQTPVIEKKYLSHDIVLSCWSSGILYVLNQGQEFFNSEAQGPYNFVVF